MKSRASARNASLVLGEQIALHYFSLTSVDEFDQRGVGSAAALSHMVCNP